MFFLSSGKIVLENLKFVVWFLGVVVCVKKLNNKRKNNDLQLCTFCSSGYPRDVENFSV